MSDLLPCPFCGSTMQVAMRDAMICLECYASGPQGEDRKALWNRRASPATDARAEALKEASAIAQGYHDRAIEWAKTVRGLEQHIGETDSSRIADAILALIPETKP